MKCYIESVYVKVPKEKIKIVNDFNDPFLDFVDKNYFEFPLTKDERGSGWELKKGIYLFRCTINSFMNVIDFNKEFISLGIIVELIHREAIEELKDSSYFYFSVKLFDDIYYNKDAFFAEAFTETYEFEEDGGEGYDDDEGEDEEEDWMFEH